MLYLCVSDPAASGFIRSLLGSEDTKLEHPIVNPKSKKILELNALFVCADPDAHESIRNHLGSEDPNLEHRL